MEHVEERIVVDASPEDAYTCWRHLSHFPRFIAGVEEISEIDSTHWRWRYRGPQGRVLEWDAELTADEPNRAIAWQALGPGVATSARVSFAARQGGGAEVLVQIDWDDQSNGLLDPILAGLLPRPEQALAGHLRRFKALVEALAGRWATAVQALGPALGGGTTVGS